MPSCLILFLHWAPGWPEEMFCMPRVRDSEGFISKNGADGAAEPFWNKKIRLTLWSYFTTQPAITCSKLIMETLEQGVKYI